MKKRKTMIRKQLYIEPEQNTFLREHAVKYNVSEGQIVREALNTFTKTMPQTNRVDLNVWEEELKFIRQRQKDLKSSTLQTWKRSELYDR